MLTSYRTAPTRVQTKAMNFEEKYEITDGEDTDISDGKSINSLQVGSDTRIF